MSAGRPIRRLTTLIIGWSLIVLGFFGLFLPFLQGILFIVLGVYVLSREYHWAHRILEHLRQRFPWVDEKLEGAKRRRHERRDG